MAIFLQNPITTLSTDSYAKSRLSPDVIDFTEAAETIHTVVHVKTCPINGNPMLEYYYGYKGGQTQEQVGTGSGVIISADGYIVTNNHVIKMPLKLKSP
jgi:S1-C subfamily serine protease